MAFNIKKIFIPDYEHYQGVRKINIYLLRVLYFLIALAVGKDSWTFLLTKVDSVSPMEAVTWSVWAGFSLVAILGLIHPLKMLPIIFLEIAYKIIWLAFVAYPLWSTDALTGSQAEGLTLVFLWVLLPIIAVPWGYAIKSFVLRPKN
jgi:hypothetical protein